tara:strand:+ start:318 stop:545 length:228 start_codon:yes stop_codon:yes gene_type:complete
MNEDEFIDILQRFATDEKYNELNVVDAVDTYAKEQVIKELERLKEELTMCQDNTNIEGAVSIFRITKRIKELKQK